MIAAIADADVVLVNPTHVAVALKYEPGKSAPRVVAKGAGNIAARIRHVEEARRAAEPSHLAALQDFACRAYRRPLAPAPQRRNGATASAFSPPAPAHFTPRAMAAGLSLMG